jgi:hypothetical protein
MRYALISDITPICRRSHPSCSMQPVSGTSRVFHLGDVVGTRRAERVRALLRSFRVEGSPATTTAPSHRLQALRAVSTRTRSRRSRHTSLRVDAKALLCRNEALLGSLPFGWTCAQGRPCVRTQVTLVHGTPTLNTLYWTEERKRHLLPEYAAQAGPRGRRHLLGTPTSRGTGDRGDSLRKHGSVGRPKDSDWRAGYVLLDMSGEMPVVSSSAWSTTSSKPAGDPENATSPTTSPSTW